MMFFLVGCYDQGYGPSLENGFDQDILIEIEYEKADKQKGYWRPCLIAFIGKKDDEVKRIIVSKDDVVLHDLDRAALANYLKKENQHKGDSVWKIDSEGISLSVEQRECSKSAASN